MKLVGLKRQLSQSKQHSISYLPHKSGLVPCRGSLPGNLCSLLVAVIASLLLLLLLLALLLLMMMMLYLEGDVEGHRQINFCGH